MVYKSLKGLSTIHGRNVYKFIHDVSGRVTRHSEKIKLSLAPGSHLKVYTDSFQFSSAEAWNRSTAHVSENQLICVFNAQYFKWYAGHN